MFITFEGVDASGKTSCINKIKKYIENKYNINDFVFTREPGGTNVNVAEEIRNLILDNKNEIDSVSEALLYLTSRNLHIIQVIKPALEENKIVICDRYIDSSIAYQGNARNIGMKKIETLNLSIVGNIIPQYTFYFRIDGQTSINRLKKERQEIDRLEKEGINFINKAIEGYEYLAKKYKKRYIIIDAMQPIEKVFEDVVNKLELIFKKSKLII